MYLKKVPCLKPEITLTNRDPFQISENEGFFYVVRSFHDQHVHAKLPAVDEATCIRVVITLIANALVTATHTTESTRRSCHVKAKEKSQKNFSTKITLSTSEKWISLRCPVATRKTRRVVGHATFPNRFEAK